MGVEGSPCWFVMSSGKMTPRAEERMSSGSVVGLGKWILSVSILGVCFLSLLGLRGEGRGADVGCADI